MMNQRYQTKIPNRGQRPRSVSARACVRAVASHRAKEVLAELAGEYKAALPGLWLERAFADAEAVAWSTPYPLLFLPELAREKIDHVRHWTERQQQILQASLPYALSVTN
jgi:hypothetical protein